MSTIEPVAVLAQNPDSDREMRTLSAQKVWLSVQPRTVPMVGQSKRYAASYGRLMDERIEEFVMREELIMLTAAELDVENCRPTDFPEPRRVYAWVRYPSKAIRVQAHAIAYTRTAVKIRFLEPLIKIQREGWVWLNAVTPAP
jgi:hypothetical protein